MEIQSLAVKDNSVPMCPSAPPQAGALLLGRFTEEGSLAFAAKPLPVGTSFLAAAGQGGGDIGKRFRFASPCLKCACSRWQDGKCIVASAAALQAKQVEVEKTATLPNCAIRSNCRWFEQEGARACAICPQVVYDMNEVT